MEHALSSLLHLLAALIGATSFAVIFRTPRRYLVPTIAIAFASAVGRGLCPSRWHLGFATFITTLGVGCLAHLLARRTRAPAQCFLIPGVIVLVPGAHIYRAFAAALEQRFAEVSSESWLALTITLGIVFGLLMSNVLLPPRKTL